MSNILLPPFKNCRKVVVIGAGPVGCLAAIAFAKMNWEVEIYEARPGKEGQCQLSGHAAILIIFLDLRLLSSKAVAQQRSINLAISSRGIAALRAVDASTADRFLETAIPMRGRMIHDRHGNLQSQLYDKDGQVCLSVHILTPLCD